MASRFHSGDIVNGNGKFNGQIVTHPERLNIPLKRRKPTVLAVWNDLHHESVPYPFRNDAYAYMIDEDTDRHVFLILTKRPQELYRHYANMEESFGGHGFPPHIWHGLTVCNQQEADAKIMHLMDVPGKKFLSLEPLLGPIDLTNIDPLPRIDHSDVLLSFDCLTGLMKGPDDVMDSHVDAVILGGETGPGARPMHPDWVRSVRDQCAAVGVPFFFKGWGEWYISGHLVEEKGYGYPNARPKRQDLIDITIHPDRCPPLGEPVQMRRLGRNNTGRHLDGRTHDDLPWFKGEKS
jgi:protein gp37